MENVVAAPLPLYGYLQKKGEKGLVRSYKKRWFEQNGAKIFYFHEKGEKTALGFIDCLEISTVRRTDELGTASPATRSSVRRDASVPFEIITPKRVYEFIASTEKDCLYWVDGINQFLRYQEAMLDTQGMMAAHTHEVSSLQGKLEDVKKRHMMQSMQWDERSKDQEKELIAAQERSKRQEADLEAKQKELERMEAEAFDRMRELTKTKKELEFERKQREESDSRATRNEEAAKLELSRAEERLLERVADREREIVALQERLAKKDFDMLDYMKSQSNNGEAPSGNVDASEADRLRAMFESQGEEHKRETERIKAQYEHKLTELAQAKEDEARKRIDELERIHGASLDRLTREATRKAEESEAGWSHRAKEFESRIEELRRKVVAKKAKIKQRNGWLRELEDQAKQVREKTPDAPATGDAEGRLREMERSLRDKELELQDRERELSELKAKLAVTTKQKKAIKVEVKDKLNEMEKVLLKKSQEMHAMRDCLHDKKRQEQEQEDLNAELVRQSDQIRQQLIALEDKDDRIRQLQRLSEEREAEAQARIAAMEADLDQREREIEALKRERDESQQVKGESKSSKKLREELETALGRAQGKAQSKEDMLRALNHKLVEVESDLEDRLRAKDETIEHLTARLADANEQKNALADRFEELLKSSQHGSRDEAERKRKQEDEVNELRLALRLKNEEVLMLTDCGAARRGKSSDDEADNAIMQEKMEELRQELFYSLAVGIKLNLSMQGIQCTQSITELYEDAKRDGIPTSAWNSWIFHRLQRRP